MQYLYYVWYVSDASLAMMGRTLRMQLYGEASQITRRAQDDTTANGDAQHSLRTDWEHEQSVGRVGRLSRQTLMEGSLMDEVTPYPFGFTHYHLSAHLLK